MSTSDEHFVTTWAAQMKALAEAAGMTLPELMAELMAEEEPADAEECAD